MDWTTLLLGIIIGWTLEWLLELFYFRDKRTGGGNVGAGASGSAAAGAAGAAAGSGSGSGAGVGAGAASNDLKKVSGIGPAFEKRLNAAGISSFADLAAHTADEIEAIIKPEEWQEFDFVDWIRQAKKLAGK